MKYAIEDYVPFLLAEKSSFFEDAAPKMQPYQVKPPAGWQTWSDRHWTYLLAPGELPAQGWKIHLSAGYEDEEELLRAAAEAKNQLQVHGQPGRMGRQKLQKR